MELTDLTEKEMKKVEGGNGHEHTNDHLSPPAPFAEFVEDLTSGEVFYPPRIE